MSFPYVIYFRFSKQPEYDIKFLTFFQSLDFDLIVYAPYRSIEGFIDDMEVSFIYLFPTAKQEVQLAMLPCLKGELSMKSV